MAPHQRGLRAELAAMLAVDQYTHEYITPTLPPPSEQTSAHLATLISHATAHPDEARTVYAHLPALMLRIFGFEVGHGWLETCSELPSRDRDALVALVLPDGPIHKFCAAHTRKRTDKVNLSADMRFEFPLANLPASTQRALRPSEAAARRPAPSYLAPLLASSLRDSKDLSLLLSPLDYFFICMIASPTQKWVPFGPSASLLKMPKRSRSIPSIRAQYNHVIAAYATRLTPSDRVDTNNIFIATCLDFLFLPWVTAESTSLPRISTSTADAVASLLLSFAPSSPDSLDLDSDFTNVGPGPQFDLKLLTNTSALYRLTGAMLEGVFSNFDAAAPPFPLIAYLRVLALFMAPWRGNVHTALKTMLYPKPKPPSSAASARSPSMAALSSTLSTINAHLSSPTGSPNNVSSVKETVWRASLRRRQHRVDRDLLRRAIVLAANHRLGSMPDGAKVLMTLGEAAQAARLSSVSSGEQDQVKTDELQWCLHALKEQKLQMERKTGRRERNFVNLLALNVGQRIDAGGVLSGISEMVHSGSTNGMAGVVNMVSAARNGSSSSAKKRLHERRSAMISGAQGQDVPFLGSVWDRPIAQGESETLVLMAYWLALRLERRLGFVPDMRFLGQYWIWVMASFVLLSFLGLRRLFLSLG